MSVSCDQIGKPSSCRRICAATTAVSGTKNALVHPHTAAPSLMVVVWDWYHAAISSDVMVARGGGTMCRRNTRLSVKMSVKISDHHTMKIWERSANFIRDSRAASAVGAEGATTPPPFDRRSTYDRSQ